MAGGEPLVSVVIPAWNAEATIVQTLQSVAAQTYRHLEIIIVDDGSVDATAALVTEFCASEPRALMINRPNGGPAAARNSGIARARGDWIALIDADDLWHPTKIEKQLAVALGAKDPPGFVYCWYRRIDEDGFVTGSGPRWIAERDAFLPLAYLHFIRGGSSLLLSKAAFLEAGGYDESFREGCEDIVLELEIARRRPIAVVPEYLFGYRIHPSNFTRDFDLLLAGWQRAFASLRERLPPDLVRKMEAQSSVAVAVQRAVERQPRQSLTALLRAITLDPIRSGLCFVDTGLGVVARRLRKPPTTTKLHRFDRVGTRERIDGLRGQSRWTNALIERLDARRIRRLSKS